MLRVLLVLIAVLIAVLAFVFDRPWLYAGAAVPLVGALALFGRYVKNWTGTSSAYSASSPTTNESMSDLGIMDVRPQERDGESDGASSSGEEKTEETPSQDGTKAQHVSRGSAQQAVPEREPGRTTVSPPLSDADPSAHERPVLGPLLESLRAAVSAETVCLLVQEDVALEYKIEALASVHSTVQREGHFETNSPLLTATMSRQSVTVWTVDKAERSDLGFYDTPPPVTQVAVAPVGRPDTASTVFLLADGTSEVDFRSSNARSLLDHFVDTVERVRDAGTGGASPADGEMSDKEGPTAVEDTERAPVDEEDSKEDTPRPRREIIAEEMDAADDASEPLALLLVHLNRAESIARQGEEMVDRTEQHLRSRLEDLAPGERVERFGELTYGIFLRREAPATERWAVDLQEAMAGETGVLEGGVSVGVAVRGPDHEPEELRADATDALLEAYETGTCTIIT